MIEWCGTVGESVVFVFEAERDSENIDHIAFPIGNVTDNKSL